MEKCQATLVLVEDSRYYRPSCSLQSGHEGPHQSEPGPYIHEVYEWWEEEETTTNG